MNSYSRVYAAIDLDAVESNMRAMKDSLPPSTSMIGVVKTDGYGHGAVPVARTIDPYVEGYAVAAIDEAVILRRHGIQKMILVLGVTHESRFGDLVRYDIRPAMFRYEEAGKLSEAAVKNGARANIHLAVDTGMSRIGMAPDEASADEAARIARLPGIRIEGMFTHFARADEADLSFAQKQYETYQEFVKLIEEAGIEIPLKHCNNSAGILWHREGDLDAVRPGITIYGVYPSDEVINPGVELKPVMSLKSHISHIKEVEKGIPVSYGGTFVTTRDMTKIATIPVGYADGYPRGLSNKGSVLIHGQRAQILGRVCMDQFMADVTDIADVQAGDEVTLLGKDGDDCIPVEELSQISGRFPYEFLCCISKRVPRVYHSQDLHFHL